MDCGRLALSATPRAAHRQEAPLHRYLVTQAASSHTGAVTSLALPVRRLHRPLSEIERRRHPDNCESCRSANRARLMALSRQVVRDESLSGAELPLLIVTRLDFHDAAENEPHLAHRRMMPALVQPLWKLNELHARRGILVRLLNLTAGRVRRRMRKRNFDVLEARFSVTGRIKSDELHWNLHLRGF